MYIYLLTHVLQVNEPAFLSLLDNCNQEAAVAVTMTVAWRDVGLEAAALSAARRGSTTDRLRRHIKLSNSRQFYVSSSRRSLARRTRLVY